MSRSKLFVESFVSKEIAGLSFGVMRINKETLMSAIGAAAQSMPVDDAHAFSIKNSILSNGYNYSFPIVLNDRFVTIDGYTRLKACIELVQENLIQEILIPFFTSDLGGRDFNSSSRGTSVEDIKYLFKIGRHGRLLTGASTRAAEQAVEASQMLDVSKLDDNFDLAFKASRIQRHTSKIVREQDAFVRAYGAVCEISTELGLNPDDIKWAHWMALFCRRGVTTVTKAIAKTHVIENKGTTQKQRYNAFVKCVRDDEKLGGL